MDDLISKIFSKIPGIVVITENTCEVELIRQF